MEKAQANAKKQEGDKDLGLSALADYNKRSLKKRGLPKDKYGRVIYNAPDIEKKEYYNKDDSLSEMDLDELENELGADYHAELQYVNKRKEERVRQNEQSSDSLSIGKITPSEDYI